MLVRTSLISAIGFFDSDYFMYTEDVDYCHRARRIGRKVPFVPSARLLHKVSKPSRIVSIGYVEQKIYRNAFLFMKKNVKWYHWLVFLMTLVLYGIRRLLMVSIHEPAKCGSIIRGTILGMREILRRY